MSNGFAFWYENDWTPQRAVERITSLDAAGLRLAHPSTGRITALSGDDDTAGEQIDIDRATLLERAAVQADQEFDFQYWIDVDVDVVCAIERLTPDLVVQRLYLDGLSSEQQRFVIAVVFDQIRTSPRSTRGLIIDLTGGSGNEDWDALTAGAPERIAVRADAMVLPSAAARQHPELHAGVGVRLGDLITYDPHGLLPTMSST